MATPLPDSDEPAVLELELEPPEPESQDEGADPFAVASAPFELAGHLVRGIASLVSPSDNNDQSPETGEETDEEEEQP